MGPNVDILVPSRTVCLHTAHSIALVNNTTSAGTIWVHHDMVRITISTIQYNMYLDLPNSIDLI